MAEIFLNQSGNPAASLDELLALGDERFLICAYQSLLGRAPDPEGLQHFLFKLRAGDSKIEILSQLRRSREGKSRPEGVVGLDKALNRNRRLKTPLLGTLFRLVGANPVEENLQQNLLTIENALYVQNRKVQQQFAEMNLAMAKLTEGVESHVEMQSQQGASVQISDFDAEWYLRQNPDVQASGMDPYDHYSRHGKAEGRFPAFIPLSNDIKSATAANLVSIIIPSYNHSQYIRQAVESVLAQSHSNLELIVIDDGSTDNSLEYLRSISDSRFTLVEQENAGAHIAINRGLVLSKGEYLAILNSDDVFHPERLSACIPRLKDGVDLVATWIEVVNRDGDVLGIKEGWNNMLPWPAKQPENTIENVDRFFLNLLMTNFVSTTSNIVFTRRLYEKIGGMKNLRFAHDWDFLIRATRHFRCELIDKPLLQYRIHQTNTISSNRAWMLFEICWVFAVHLKWAIPRLFSQSAATDCLPYEINFLANSINLQGNDKVLWMLLHYFNECANAGDNSAEEALLADENLRKIFIQHIV